MLEVDSGGDLSAALLNAILLALWAALPALVVGYARAALLARKQRPEFMLQKSERAELGRAVAVYEKVRTRLEQIRESDELISSFWQAALRRRPNIQPEHNDELDDLEAHAQHLQAMIFRLRRQPLIRLKSWIQRKSLHSAAGYAITVYVVSFTLLWTLAFGVSDQPAWAQELQSGAGNGVVWYPFDERIFYANAVAIGFSSLVMPVVYLIRRQSLRRQCSLEFCVFEDLADIGPNESVYDFDFMFTQSQAREQDVAGEIDKSEANESWIRILGVSEAASIQEVKQAYKALIKQNHPDRVQGMSLAFKQLAEIETKKINAAYRQALNSASPA
jgi:hypothetical protein